MSIIISADIDISLLFYFFDSRVQLLVSSSAAHVLDHMKVVR